MMTTYAEFAAAGKELSEALPTLNEAELENGLKCFGILYLQLENLDMLQEHNAPRFYDMIAKKCMHHELEMWHTWASARCELEGQP